MVLWLLFEAFSKRQLCTEEAVSDGLKSVVNKNSSEVFHSQSDDRCSKSMFTEPGFLYCWAYSVCHSAMSPHISVCLARKKTVSANHCPEMIIRSLVILRNCAGQTFSHIECNVSHGEH